MVRVCMRRSMYLLGLYCALLTCTAAAELALPYPGAETVYTMTVPKNKPSVFKPNASDIFFSSRWQRTSTADKSTLLDALSSYHVTHLLWCYGLDTQHVHELQDRGIFYEGASTARREPSFLGGDPPRTTRRAGSKTLTAIMSACRTWRAGIGQCMRAVRTTPHSESCSGSKLLASSKAASIRSRLTIGMALRTWRDRGDLVSVRLAGKDFATSLPRNFPLKRSENLESKT